MVKIKKMLTRFLRLLVLIPAGTSADIPVITEVNLVKSTLTRASNRQQESAPWIYNDHSCELKHFNSSQLLHQTSDYQNDEMPPSIRSFESHDFYYCANGNGVVFTGEEIYENDRILLFNEYVCGHSGGCEYLINDDWCIKGYEGDEYITLFCPDDRTTTELTISPRTSEEKPTHTSSEIENLILYIIPPVFLASVAAITITFCVLYCRFKGRSAYRRME